jgi:hypothetical protein
MCASIRPGNTYKPVLSRGRGAAPLEVTDIRDSIAADAQISAERWCTGAVDDPSGA